MIKLHGPQKQISPLKSALMLPDLGCQTICSICWSETGLYCIAFVSNTWWQANYVYFSTKLDPVAAGLPLPQSSIRHRESHPPGTLFWSFWHHSQGSTCCFSQLLNTKIIHFCIHKGLKYHTILHDMPNITVKRYSTLNPATLLTQWSNLYLALAPPAPAWIG